MNNHILPISASDHSTIPSGSAPESHLNAEVIQQTEKGFDQIDLILALMNRLAMNSKQTAPASQVKNQYYTDHT